MKTIKLIIALLLCFTELSAQKYEMRAAWLTTIGGADWPVSRDARMQKEEFCNMLEQLKKAGVNTILLQTRIRATTIYPSDIEPWDYCLTGTPGKSPGYDPLQMAVEECHKRGLQCHAWVVTLPIGKWSNQGCQLLRKKHPKIVRKIGDEGYMNPEMPETANYLARICGEMVRRYDIDGLHLDYIRYPETWKLKVSRQQGREHITRIVAAIHKAVKQEKPWVMLSCAPIGKHDDLARYSSRGWNARTAVCQDAQAWLRDGLMDALFPMMYFQGNNFFPFAIDWQEHSYGRIVTPGLGIYFLDPREGRWSLSEVIRQMNVSRQLGMGHCYFRVRFLLDNHKDIRNFAAEFDATPALVPPMTWYGFPAPDGPKTLQADKNRLTWSGAKDNSDGLHLLYNIYASKDFPVDISDARNLIATRLNSTSIALPDPNINYAVTATDRYGLESPACQLLLNAGDYYAAPTMAIATGQYVSLTEMPQGLDVEYLIIENLQGQMVRTLPYTGKSFCIKDLPNGVFVVKSLGRKGITHRLGFFAVKR